MLNLPNLIGHRGVRDLCPENTLDSVELAQKLGLKWVEVDAKITKDLIPILLHDDKLDRTTNGKGLPTNYNYSDIKKLDAGIKFYNHSTKIFIPTLEQVLIYCQNNNLGINIELKPNNSYEKENVQAIANLIKDLNFSNQFYFSSFDWPSIFLMQEYLPEANYGLLIDNFINEISLDNILIINKKYKIQCCGFNKRIINQEIIKKLQKNNLLVTVYADKNINPKEANELWSIGVKSIFIDNPSLYGSGG